MKKIFTLLAAALVTLTSFADYSGGSITIVDNSRKQLWVEVDGFRYSNQGNRPICIDDLRPGAHRITVFIDKRNRDWDDLFDRGGKRRIIYNSTVYTRPFTSIIITVDRNSTVFVEEKRIGRGNDRDWDRDHDRNRDRDRDRDRDDRDWDRNRRDNDYDRDNGFDPRRSPMDAQSFEMLKRALSRESFENSRLEIVKQTIDRNNFTASQVRQLALLFAFENNKLDLAKYAYRKTVDKNNYFVVYDVFSFSRSKEELVDYTRKY
jgi:Domain of unknown function (DUF4476)